ncbi:MAG TPA: VC0807 family protein [Caulobacteraceae bacterium]
MPPTVLSRARTYLRANGLAVGVEIVVNFAGPYLIFTLAKPALGEVNALIASSAPPIAWSIIEFARRRRVDAISILVLAGIALSLLAFVGGGGVRFLQLREKLVTGLIGLIFLGSAAIGRPLIYQLARASSLRRSPSAAAELEALSGNIYFRRTMTTMTLVWGFGLVIECAVASALVFTLSVAQFLLVGPIVGYTAVGLLVLWSVWFVRRARRLGAARRAAAEAAAKTP